MVLPLAPQLAKSTATRSAVMPLSVGRVPLAASRDLHLGLPTPSAASQLAGSARLPARPTMPAPRSEPRRVVEAPAAPTIPRGRMCLGRLLLPASKSGEALHSAAESAQVLPPPALLPRRIATTAAPLDSRPTRPPPTYARPSAGPQRLQQTQRLVPSHFQTAAGRMAPASQLATWRGATRGTTSSSAAPTPCPRRPTSPLTRAA